MERAERVFRQGRAVRWAEERSPGRSTLLLLGRVTEVRHYSSAVGAAILIGTISRHVGEPGSVEGGPGAGLPQLVHCSDTHLHTHTLQYIPTLLQQYRPACCGPTAAPAAPAELCWQSPCAGGAGGGGAGEGSARRKAVRGAGQSSGTAPPTQPRGTASALSMPAESCSPCC